MTPYWMRKAEDARIVGEALRMLWLRVDPAMVAAFIDGQVAR
jgi:hypothetical protein